MRFVNIKHLRREVDLETIEEANAEIADLPEEERGAYIDRNYGRWTNLRTGLWRLGFMKCWYSEATLQAGEGQVEHFRPKKRLSGARHSGYWWCAFDWTNLRLAHPTVNLRREDYLTGEQAGKGCYFPLCDENFRATQLEDQDGETPLLLDPITPEDCRLICFDAENGKVISAFSKESNELNFRRVKASINFYHLNDGTWNAKRQDLMNDVSTLCDRIIEAKNDGDDVGANRLIDELIVDYTDNRSEFSSAAMQVVREKGLLEGVAV